MKSKKEVQIELKRLNDCLNSVDSQELGKNGAIAYVSGLTAKINLLTWILEE